MPGHDIIVIGASAGGVEALGQLFGNLDLDIPAAIFVVLHIPADSNSYLPRLINRAIEKRSSNSALKAVHPKDGETIERGRIYVAPPDRHLLVQNGYIQLARGPKENSTRPAIDPLFRTAARAYGRRVVGVVLSGALDDGTAGLMAIKQQGGVAIVQNPKEALYPGMPHSAIENVPVDRILSLSDIPSALVQLASQEVQQQAQSVSNEMEMEADMASLELGAMQNSARPGIPSAFGCPECGGVLWELNEDRLTRFRCRTGHAYSIHSLLAKQDDGLEDALWNALRALEEKAALTKRMAKRARDRQQLYSTERFTQQAHSAQEQATLLREILLTGDSPIHLSTLDNDLIETKNLQSDGTGAQSAVSLQKQGNGRKTKQKSQSENGNSQFSTHSKLFCVVAICASAGGLDATRQILSALPADFGAAITVVQQVDSDDASIIPEILARHTALDVKYAQQGDVLVPATVYIAPPEQHLLVNPDGTLCLFSSNLVHFTRPSADLLLESVAASFRGRAIAVMLKGTGNEGTVGIRAIKQMGGRAIAQEPDSDELFDMAAAIDTDMMDLILPLQQMATNLLSLVRTWDRELSDS